MRLIAHNYAQDPMTVITASTQNNNFPASNLAKEHRSKQWRSTSNVDQWVQFDIKTTEAINSVVLLWPKGAYKLSDAASLRVQASATSNFVTTGVDEYLTFNNQYEMASLYFETAQNYRYWRILINDHTNIHGFVNLGVVILGMAESLDKPDNGFQFTQSDTSNVTTTEFGQSYVDVLPIIKTLDLNFALMDYDIASNFINMYTQIGIRKPVFVVLDEMGTVFDKDIFSIYGRFNNSHGVTHITYDLFQSSLTITESN